MEFFPLNSVFSENSLKMTVSVVRVINSRKKRGDTDVSVKNVINEQESIDRGGGELSGSGAGRELLYRVVSISDLRPRSNFLQINFLSGSL